MAKKSTPEAVVGPVVTEEVAATADESTPEAVVEENLEPTPDEEDEIEAAADEPVLPAERHFARDFIPAGETVVHPVSQVFRDFIPADVPAEFACPFCGLEAKKSGPAGEEEIRKHIERKHQ